MKFKWPALFGASVILGAVSSTLFHQKSKTPQELIATYVGSWAFYYPKERIPHTLAIYPDLSLTIDGKAVIYHLIELSESKFAIQDQLGYHLVIQTENSLPATIYDEADDVTVPITLITALNDPHKNDLEA